MESATKTTTAARQVDEKRVASVSCCSRSITHPQDPTIRLLNSFFMRQARVLSSFNNVREMSVIAKLIKRHTP